MANLLYAHKCKQKSKVIFIGAHTNSKLRHREKIMVCAMKFILLLIFPMILILSHIKLHNIKSQQDV